MAPRKKGINKMLEVFISYSRKDREVIAPIVELIRAMKDDLVFQDYQNIKRGKRWKPQLLNAISKAAMIVVFWCEHSAKSQYVKEEYGFAIDKDKDVLPLLLDNSELADALSEYQWIDLKGFHVHQPEPTLRPSFPSRIGGKSLHYPKDKSGDYVNWDYERRRQDLEQALKAFQENNENVARIIVGELEKRISGDD